MERRASSGFVFRPRMRDMTSERFCGVKMSMGGETQDLKTQDAREEVSRFHRLRIQTVRHELDDDGEIAPFTEEDEPFDENYGEPVFRIYGVGESGLLEHIADPDTYQAARSLMVGMLPGIGLPEVGIGYSKRLVLIGGSSGP